MGIPAKDRFLKYVLKDEDNGCWLWQACTTTFGYGQFYFERRLQNAHRVSWQIFNGDLPRGIFVCHKCDNPPCVNPDHLFLGTHEDNMDDRKNKRRFVHGKKYYGSSSPFSKLTDEQVLEILSLYNTDNVQQKELAKRFGVTQACIWYIVNGKTYKDLTERISKNIVMITCKGCGCSFKRENPQRKFCNKKCKASFFNKLNPNR